MAAGIPERDVHGGPEMLFQLLPSLWVCHPLFRRTAARISCCGRRGRLFFFPSCSLISAGGECRSESADSQPKGGTLSKKCE